MAFRIASATVVFLLVSSFAFAQQQQQRLIVGVTAVGRAERELPAQAQVHLKIGISRAFAVTGDVRHPDFPNVPEIETFAKNDLDRKIIAMQRAFRVTGTPFVLPPGTPKDRVQVLQDAFRKTYKDPEFAKHYQKLTSDEPSPLLPEDHERAIRDVPRDQEAVEVFKRLANAVALPPRR